jgi:hypothetical protein
MLDDTRMRSKKCEIAKSKKMVSAGLEPAAYTVLACRDNPYTTRPAWIFARQLATRKEKRVDSFTPFPKRLPSKPTPANWRSLQETGDLYHRQHTNLAVVHFG